MEHLTKAVHAEQLEILGLLHEDAETIVLLGPREPDFWGHVSASREFADGRPDPLDRWSKRALKPIAETFAGIAVFPSDGPPYPPFISWALASNRAWVSPVGMLVHDLAGLFVSYRAALHLPVLLPIPPSGRSPCTDCAQPCRTACPVDALRQDAYDVPLCKTHIGRIDSADCGAQGCAARRACPVSKAYGRKPAQSAFHMRAFLGE
ncbi:MAG: ferredoxin [Planktotalea sp.]|uniref:ferredoxin n=1 Tax=Planktotalea sp. TaxID=2029877 RepID=UPI003C723E80